MTMVKFEPDSQHKSITNDILCFLDMLHRYIINGELYTKVDNSILNCFT